MLRPNQLERWLYKLGDPTAIVSPGIGAKHEPVVYGTKRFVVVLANGPIYACAKGSFNCVDRPDHKVKPFFRATIELPLVFPDTYPSGGSQR